LKFGPRNVAEYWLASCLAELESCGSEKINLAYVSPAITVWDDCCGQLTVTVENIYRSNPFPAEASTDERCDDEVIAVVILAALVRCLPTVDGKGRPPTQEQLQASGERILDDQGVMWRAMAAPMPSTYEWERSFIRQTTVVPTGGCVAIETRATIGIDESRWCQDC
jgi:hypothetical protein